MDRSEAEGLDRGDSLGGFRDRFDLRDPPPVYLDGNSLGVPAHAVVESVGMALQEWRDRLVGGWHDWIDLPQAVGDRIGRLIGAAPGQTVVCDSTTVNLYKLASAALALRAPRPEILADRTEFPTDRYVLEGLAASHGRRLMLVGEDQLGDVLSERTALLCLSHVHYRSGVRRDIEQLTAAVHSIGGLVLWDLSHSAGAVPVRLDEWDVDLAVGCTYKYLNAGPGAPAFLYVNKRLQDSLRQPIWGWFGRARQFEMGDGYEPAQGITRTLTGTPGVIGLRMVDSAATLLEEAGVDAVWAKSVMLTDLIIRRYDERLGDLGVRMETPRESGRRGAHVSVAHHQAWEWCSTLIERGRVVGDFRAPDVLRLGPAPLYTRFVDCFDAVDAMADVLAGGLSDGPPPGRVT